MLPPVGVQASVISHDTIKVSWADNSLAKNQKITDSRFYTVRWTKEINALEKVFSSSKKEFQITMNSGNAANLRHIISQRPKILHLSCHGGYECEDGESKVYLYLEDAKQPGMMEKFDEETIKNIFCEGASDDQIAPRLVFISACHSQKFGEIIKEAGDRKSVV